MCYKLALCFQKRITNATFCQSRCYKKGSFSHLFKKKNVLTAVVSVLYFFGYWYFAERNKSRSVKRRPNLSQLKDCFSFFKVRMHCVLDKICYPLLYKSLHVSLTKELQVT